MKKITAILLLLTLCISLFASCGKETAKINVGVMNGPTGMGMAKLINDNGMDSEKYSFTTYAAPSTATNALANKELDMLCVPTNLAANLTNKSSDYISVIAINCLGSLYVLTKDGITLSSFADLEGKTVLYGEPTSTTGPILNYLIEEYELEGKVSLEVLATHELVQEKLNSGEADIVVLPEPKATSAISTAKQNNQNYSFALNLTNEWSAVSDRPLTMGCIIVRNEFLKENKKAVDSFLKEYKASIEYIGSNANFDSAAQMIVDAGIIPKLPLAKSALGNLYGSIVYIDGEAMQETLENFYDAIGINKPDDNFYYEK